MTSTGVPVEWLFAVIALMVGGTYLNIIFEIRLLRKSAAKRDRKVSNLTIMIKNICGKLSIPFYSDSDNE